MYDAEINQEKQGCAAAQEYCIFRAACHPEDDSRVTRVEGTFWRLVDWVYVFIKLNLKKKNINKRINNLKLLFFF